MSLGRVAYERWREALGIPLEFAWARLPSITQKVWDGVAQAVLEYRVPDAEEGGQVPPAKAGGFSLASCQPAPGGADGKDPQAQAA